MNAFRRPPGVARLSTTPPPTTSTGFPWLDGDMLYAADLNNAFVGRDTAIAGMLPLAGGTMQGPLTLAGDATAPLQPVSLQQMTAITGGPYLPLTGGTVTGDTRFTTNIDADTGIFGGIAYPGQRAGGAARTWVGLSDLGYMTYYDVSSLMPVIAPPAYALGIASSIRSSDRLTGPNTANIAIAAFATSDSANANAGLTWSFYGTNRRVAGGASSLGAELSMGNLAPTVLLNPYHTGTLGTTAGLWLSSGSEAFEAGETVYPGSGAIGIVSNGSTWAKGIVFGVNALVPTPGSGSLLAMQLPTKGEIQWIFDGSDQRSAFIRSDATGGASNVGLIFRPDHVAVVDTATETDRVNLYNTGAIGLTGGIGFATAPTSAIDFAHGINLFNNAVGLTGYANNFNMCVPTGGNFQFLINGASTGLVDATGINFLPIGQTGARAGSFTTLAASGATTLSGTTANGLINAAAGLIFGTAATGSADLINAIRLNSGGTYGINAYGGALNLVIPSGSNFNFEIAGASVGFIDSTGMNFVNVGATGARTGAFTTLAASGATTLSSTLRVNGTCGFNNTAPIAKPTGWGTSTGGARAAITGASTLPQVAAGLAQLLTDLTSYGLLGV